MGTLAWLLILVGALVIRQSLKGRVLNLGEDLSDAFLAGVKGDKDALGEVFTRTGDNSASETDIAAWDAAGTSAMQAAMSIGSAIAATNSGIAARAILLGSKAKGYRWTATGPDYYDCSGLMWRACKDLNIYTGPRFTTATVGLLSTFTKVSQPAVNDLVVWTGHHMGVVTGTDQFYSAKNKRDGIGYAKISTWQHGAKPVYLRPVKAAKVEK